MFRGSEVESVAVEGVARLCDRAGVSSEIGGQDDISERGVTMMYPSERSVSASQRCVPIGALMVRSMLVTFDAMLILRFLLEPVPARGRLVCRFLYIGMSAASLVDPRRAGTIADFGLYSLKSLTMGPPRNSIITARKTTAIRSAG